MPCCGSATADPSKADPPTCVRSRPDGRAEIEPAGKAAREVAALYDWMMTEATR